MESQKKPRNITLNVRVGKRIVTFLGAGASATFNYPTTKVFLERLDKSIESDDERGYLNSIKILYWVVKDAEHLVQILDSIMHIEGVSEGKLLRTFFSEYKRILEFGDKTKSTTYYLPLLKGRVEWSKLIDLTERLRDHIEDFVFKQYETDIEQLPEILRVYRNYFSLLRKHQPDTRKFEVFTTNYDNVIEDYCSQSGHICTLSVLEHKINPSAKLSNEEYVLTKLHGSLNWVINKQDKRIRVSEAQSRIMKDSRSWDRNEYVLFGTKERLDESGIYAKLFERLRQRLLDADVCITVGFSFRDGHINDIFKESLQNNKDLRVVIVAHSPVQAAANLVSSERKLVNYRKLRKIVPLKCSFDTDRALSKINEALL